jgi:hypothetical protein
LLALFAARAIPAFAAAPVLTSLNPTSVSTAGGQTVTITGTGFSAVTDVTVDGTSVGLANFTVVDAQHVTFTAPAHAAGTFGVIVETDAPSNSLNLTYGPPPTVTLLSPATDDTNGGVLVTITGTNFTGATQVSFGGSNVSPMNISSTSLQANAPAHVAGTVNVTVTTPFGTSANNGTLDDFVYTQAPPTVTGLFPAGGPIGGGTVVTVSGTGFTGATGVTFGGTAGTSLTVNDDNTITVTAPAHAAGTVDVIVTTGGGPSANTSADNYLYGAVPPTVTAVSPTTGPITGGTTLTITGTGFTGATEVTIGGTAGTSLTVVSDTSLTVITPAHAAGTVDVIVKAPFGFSANTAADNFTFSAGPFVFSLNPAGGLPAGGTVVTITGTGFTGATAVTFGGTAATTFTVVSNTSITATSPAHAAGVVDVVVTTGLGTSPTTGTGNDFTYGSGPTITLISPTSGPTAGGTTVTITGTGFTGATAVNFGAVAATSFTVVSATQITAVAPAQANSVVSIRVVTPLGTSADTSADDFTYGSGSTVSFVLYFRWTLIIWSGKAGVDIQTALKGLESPDNPLTNDVSGIVTAVFHYNNPLQKFEGFFPGSAGIPGANDFTTFTKGEPYWIAINQSGNITWITLGD